MADDDPKRKEAPDDPNRVCMRVEGPVSLAQHLKCPYCYGEARDVRTGDRAAFCDFHPGEDPINFGFPGDGSRFAHG